MDWAHRHIDDLNLVRRQVGDVTVWMSRRIARYACWHTLTLTAWRFGPLASLGVVNEPMVLLEMEDWEQAHPWYDTTAEGYPGGTHPAGT